MKTLFVSDLDGTLLTEEIKTSKYTNDTINTLVEKGMIFSYATARSYLSSHKVTAGLNAKIPVVTYNGSLIMDNTDGSVLKKNVFGDDVHALIDDLVGCDVYPVVYSFIDDNEKMLFVPEKSTEGVKQFVDGRAEDERINPINDYSGYHQGEIFCITCIGRQEKLEPFYHKYKDKYHCILQRDIYLDTPWLDINPALSSKSNAVKQLKEMYGCERVVVFGDGKNDIDMFLMADEAYAMENAVDELKAVATAVIGSNNDDGVAKWLSENFAKY